MQIRQVVVRNNAGCHCFVGITPALEQYLGQRESLQVVLSGIDQLAYSETAIGSLDRASPVLHVNLQSSVQG